MSLHKNTSLITETCETREKFELICITDCFQNHSVNSYQLGGIPPDVNFFSKISGLLKPILISNKALNKTMEIVETFASDFIGESANEIFGAISKFIVERSPSFVHIPTMPASVALTSEIAFDLTKSFVGEVVVYSVGDVIVHGSAKYKDAIGNNTNIFVGNSMVSVLKKLENKKILKKSLPLPAVVVVESFGRELGIVDMFKAGMFSMIRELSVSDIFRKFTNFIFNFFDRFVKEFIKVFFKEGKNFIRDKLFKVLKKHINKKILTFALVKSVAKISGVAISSLNLAISSIIGKAALSGLEYLFPDGINRAIAIAIGSSSILMPFYLSGSYLLLAPALIGAGSIMIGIRSAHLATAEKLTTTELAIAKKEVDVLQHNNNTGVATNSEVINKPVISDTELLFKINNVLNGTFIAQRQGITEHTVADVDNTISNSGSLLVTNNSTTSDYNILLFKARDKVFNCSPSTFLVTDFRRFIRT